MRPTLAVVVAVLAAAAEAASPQMLVNTMFVHDCKG
jgi:hypothetical protein